MCESAKPLRLYVYPQFIDQKLSHTPLLFPFWPPKLKRATPFSNALWKKYQFDTSYYCLVNDLKDADYILLPHRYWLLKKFRPDLLTSFLKEAEGSGKPVLIDAYGDSDAVIPIKYACILRTSQYRFKYQPNEVILPAYVEDLLEQYYQGILDIRQKQTNPVVGFVGWASSPLPDTIRKHLKGSFFQLLALFQKQYGAYIPGVLLRKYAIIRLQDTPYISVNFIIRQTYSGHKNTRQGDLNTIRQQFIVNMFESDYILNVKGNGNYSQRFYETLSMGRIPIFINTECVLPLESQIDYRECCLFVEHHHLDRIGEILTEFHRQICPEQFLWMQQRAREIFETYLRVDVFTKYLIQELHEHLRAITRGKNAC
ncbi:MAG: exostosin family protein [Candidatus Vecturithrix sp.]|jgi:hypothetical protein|nr:exostosin family protein [Candidatus Vecturithrix sp.]